MLIPFFIFNFKLFFMVRFLVLFLGVFVCSFSFSQKIYLEGSVGYNLGMNKITPGVYNTTSTNVGGVSKNTIEQGRYSAGKGVSFSGTIGVSLTSKVGVELSLSHLVGSKLFVDNHSTYYNDFDQSTSVYSSRYEFSSRLTQMIPSLVLTFGEGDIVPFSKLGLIYSTGMLNIGLEEIDDEDVVIREIDLTGGVSFGVSTVFGVECALSEKIKLVGALDFKLLSFSPKKSEVVKYELNGVSTLEELSIESRETEYFDKIEYDSSVSSSDEPSEQLKVLMSASSLGFNLGLKFLL